MPSHIVSLVQYEGDAHQAGAINTSGLVTVGARGRGGIALVVGGGEPAFPEPVGVTAPLKDAG